MPPAAAGSLLAFCGRVILPERILEDAVVLCRGGVIVAVGKKAEQ
jgi:hypothetical protein